MSKKKLLFEVQENESIADCLDRMKEMGYMPVRRMEKPVFEEQKEGNKTEYVPIRQTIVFEGKRIEE
ncbi:MULTISPECIES: NETI motif-containing protein [Bacillaceae]|uniref:NETI motif-containing protein n=1 Tax=Bacillaceae TaxID=186817 RepID=UPI001C574236|nr:MULTISPECIES: NETI motif-containing protein [Rossellomorea]MBW3113010.1 NETI motif-containing protein [Bacillus sp. MCCB 382]MDX8346159.1 NETI motif-containing protein [Rossellomorea sp. YZS02]